MNSGGYLSVGEPLWMRYQRSVIEPSRWTGSDRDCIDLTANRR
jgi:hypothetical protein